MPRSRFLGEPFGDNHFRDISASASLRHDLDDGWQLRGDLVRSDQKEDRIYIWATNTALIVPTTGIMPRTTGAVTNSPYGSLFKSRGAYVQDVVEIGQHFVVLGGVRYSRVHN